MFIENMVKSPFFGAIALFPQLDLSVLQMAITSAVCRSVFRPALSTYYGLLAR